MFTTSCVLMWACLAQAAGPPSAGEQEVSEARAADTFTAAMTFLGFSQNDRTAAFELTLVTPLRGGGEDRYRLIQLVDIEHRRLLTSYRSGHGIQRRDAPGRAAPSQARLARLHPDWQGAQSAAAWQRVRRLAHLNHKQVDFKNALVRLLPDADSHFTLAVDDKAKRLDATYQGGAFGFTPIATLFVGGTMPLGHFRLPESRHASHARLKIYHSHTGHRIAAVAVFENRGQRLPVLVGGAVFATPDDNPLGTTAIGSLEVIQEQSRSVEADFKAMHPHGAHNWDVYVGRWF